VSVLRTERNRAARRFWRIPRRLHVLVPALPHRIRVVQAARTTVRRLQLLISETGMACDCTRLGIDEVFDERNARWVARYYRLRGLDARARKLLAALQRTPGIEGRTVLEIGAGVGALTIEMLKRGVTHATPVDASPYSVAAAHELAVEARVAARMNVIAGNFATLDLGQHVYDIVVLDRVVCCYPEWRELLEPAAQRARVAIALVYPRTAVLGRVAARTINLVHTLLRHRLRFFVHPPAQMQQLLRDRGFEHAHVTHFFMWELLIATRTT
jgi:2-polyprenyl-3-methyl-5-hydroxy-6-metoxy-1,4-benzoquinol methylase